MGTIVKVKQINKNGSKPQEKWSTEEPAVIVMSLSVCHLGQKKPRKGRFK